MKNLMIISIALLIGSGAMAQTKSMWDNVPDHVKNSEAFPRHKWLYEQRAYPYKAIPAVSYATEREKEIERIRSLSSQRNLIPEWNNIGPDGVYNPAVPHWGVQNGRMKALAVHPQDPLTVYAGAACGGLWKTTDGGETWQDLSQDFGSLAFGALAIDPANPETVYAATGEAIYEVWYPIIAGDGIYKSTDGGQSWTHITDGFGSLTHFSDISVSPHNSNLVIATIASGGYDGYNMPNEGVWRSLDGGMTWTRTLDAPDAYDVLFHPTQSNKVYAALGGENENSGFWVSSDQGATWTKNNYGNGLPDANTIGRMQIDLCRSSPAKMYAVIYLPGATTYFTEAYRTTNAGNMWNQIAVDQYLGGYYQEWSDQGDYDLCIAVDPDDCDHVFIGNVELHETTDGSTFSPKRLFGNNLLGSVAHVDYHRFAFAPSNHDYLYLGCDGGVYLSVDKGDSFESKNNGLSTLQFYRIGSHPVNYNIIIGGTQDNGVIMTVDGVSWEEKVFADGMECFFDREYPDSIVLAAIQYGTVYMSQDGGQSFQYTSSTFGTWLTPFMQHPVINGWIYIANRRILISKDHWWTASMLSPFLFPEKIQSLAISPANSANMIVASGEDTDTLFTVFVSIDSGYTWTDVTANIPGEDRWIARVVTHPIDENTMYVLRTGFSPGNKVYMTTDLGATWTNISGNLPDFPCSDLFVDPVTEFLYLGNDLGVYRSTDDGVTWEWAGLGMPFVPVFDFDYVDYGDGVRYLRAATHGRSIYETDLLEVGLEESSVAGRQPAVSIIPNPTRGIADFEFHIVDFGRVALKIYDVQGNEVAELFDGELPAGEHKIQHDIKTLPAGVYFVKVISDDKVRAGKFVKQ